ncbi:MAG: flagellar hook capping FlgD N-terminal domain-containing protein [Planctomycetaceae bacterium]
MSRINEVATTAQTTAANSTKGNSFSDLDIDQFLSLLITELQNQDPLDPTENSEIVQQIGQIRDIGATDQLTGTLSTLRESQELVTASSLIGQKIEGLADDASPVNGVVDRVTVETDNEKSTRQVKVHVGNQTMDIKNIRTINTQ